MQSDYENRLRRAQDLKAYMDENAAIWIGNVLLSNVHTKLGGLITQVEEVGVLQSSGTRLFTLSKHDLRDLVTLKMLRVGAGLSEVGEVHHNVEATVMGDFTENILKALTEEDFLSTCNGVLGFARPIESLLLGAGLEYGELDEAANGLIAFRAAMTKPRKYVSRRKAGTKSIPRLLREIDKLLLNRMDNLVKSYRRSQLAFVDGYFAARLIMDLGVRHPGAPGDAPPPTDSDTV